MIPHVCRARPVIPSLPLVPIHYALKKKRVSLVCPSITASFILLNAHRITFLQSDFSLIIMDSSHCKLASSFSLILLFLCTLLLLDSYDLNLFSSFAFIPAQRNSISFSPSVAFKPNARLAHHLHATYDNSTAKSTADEIQATIVYAKGKGKVKGRRRVEMELKRVRAAIRKAARLPHANGHTQGDAPRGAIYRNAFAFQQSYTEMEKKFKMYVYKEGEMPLVHSGPCKNIYTTEGRFIHELQLGNHFLTSDPEEAHVFFLPFSVVMMVSYVYKPFTYDLAPLKRFVSDYISVVSNKYPFWNRSLGADHAFLSCHDWAPETSKVNPYLYSKAIRVLCNANTSEGFNPAKDATLPEVNFLTGTASGMVGGNSALERPILAFFAGGNHGPVRPSLIKHWKYDNDSSSDFRVYEYLPKELSHSYYEMMKKSKYCLCPSGFEVASPRIVEAIYSECVPVIISDHYVLPFSDVLNWKAFSVYLPSTEIPNLRTILESIPLTRYVQMQASLKQVRTHFEINQPPKPYDMFHMILHSIWLRRLNVQLTQDD